MPASYELWLTTDTGSRLALFDSSLEFNATRVTKGVGTVTITLPHYFDVSMFHKDYMIQVWRSAMGGTKSLFRSYFMRKWRRQMKGEEEVILVYGFCPNSLLQRRIVASYEGLSASAKLDYADDMMKEVVSESVSDALLPGTAAGTRVWDNLTIQGETSSGPVLGIECGFKYVADTIQSIARASLEMGTEVFWDIVETDVTSSSMKLEFRTYTGQIGNDLTSSGIRFGREYGNLKDPWIEWDYSNEVNYVYAGGQGPGVLREVYQVYDPARYGDTAWARSEAFVDASNQDTLGGIVDAGVAALRAGRPKVRIGGEPLDVVNCRYGVDWNFGDRLPVVYANEEFDAIVWAVTANKVGAGRETLKAQFEYLEPTGANQFSCSNFITADASIMPVGADGVLFVDAHIVA